MRLVFLATDSRESFRQYAEPRPTFGTAPQALLQGFALLPGEVEVHILSCTKRPLPSPQTLAPNIIFHGLVVPPIGWLRTGYQGCIRAVRRKVKELRPDLVHGQGTERDCALSAILSGYPNVVTIHGNMRLIARLHRARPGSFRWLAARLERLTLPRAGGVVCITRYTQEAVASLARRTWIVPNAVDESFFALAPERPATPRVLCVANVDPRKNQLQLVHALEELARRRGAEIDFLGGADRETPYARDFFRVIATRPWCHYEGFADRERLKGFFRKASLLILPSLEDNCPMSVLEAMAAGVPVVASRVGGVPELITHEETGLLCDPQDPASIAAAVDRVLREPAAAAARAARARTVAQARFHPRTIATRHLEIYREVLGS